MAAINGRDGSDDAAVSGGKLNSERANQQVVHDVAKDHQFYIMEYDLWPNPPVFTLTWTGYDLSVKRCPRKDRLYCFARVFQIRTYIQDFPFLSLIALDYIPPS